MSYRVILVISLSIVQQIRRPRRSIARCPFSEVFTCILTKLVGLRGGPNKNVSILTAILNNNYCL